MSRDRIFMPYGRQSHLMESFIYFAALNVPNRIDVVDCKLSQRKCEFALFKLANLMLGLPTLICHPAAGSAERIVGGKKMDILVL